MSKPRVGRRECLVVFSADAKPLPGGIAEYLHRVCEYIGKEHYAVVLATTVPGNESYSPRYHTVQRLERSPQGGKKDLLGWLLRTLRLSFLYTLVRERYLVNRQFSEILESYSPRLVAIGVWSPETYFWAVECRKRGIPYVVFTFGLELRPFNMGRLGTPAYEMMRFRTLARSSAIISISRATAEAVEKLGVERSRIHVIPPGVDEGLSADVSAAHIETATRQVLRGRAPFILSVCRLVERKGVDTMLRALPVIVERFSECLYVVVGSGPEDTRLRNLALELDLKENVLFTGRVSEDMKKALLALCDVFVLPCKTLPDGDMEGFGLVFLEAAAFGKPSIAGRYGGAVDAVVDGETGLLVDSFSSSDVASAVLALLENKSLAERFGRQAKVRSREMSWSRTCDEVVNILNNVASRKT